MKQAASRIWALFRASEAGLGINDCPICGKTILVRLANNAIAVRCLRCGGSAIHMSVAKLLNTLYPKMSHLTAYEMSSRGALYKYLSRRIRHLTFSEFYDDVEPGRFKGPVQCQDVQRLTYADATFDLCTSTEVFEHVADDRCGFGEVCRVLRPGGRFVFTVPLTVAEKTIERAIVINGSVQHLLEPEYHGDSFRGYGKVLCFRNYGLDILQKLRDAGFRHAVIAPPDAHEWWGLGVKVVVAET